MESGRDILYQIGWSFVHSFKGFTEEQINDMKQEASRFNETNCWWLIHRLKPLFIEILTDIQDDIKKGTYELPKTDNQCKEQ